MGRRHQPIHYVARRWRSLVVIAVLTALGAALSALEPWPLKLLVDDGLAHGTPPGRVVAFLGGPRPTASTIIAVAAVASVALFAAGAIINIALNWLWAVAGQRMVFDLSTDLFNKLQRLSLAYHARNPVGDSLARLGRDTWSLYTLASRLFAPVEQLLTLVAIGALAARLNLRLTLLALAAAPLLAAISLAFGPRLKSRAKTGREAEGRVVAFVHQTLSRLSVVQAFTAEARNAARLGVLSTDVVTSARRAALVESGHGLASGLVTALGAAGVLWAGGRAVMAGALSLGGLIVFLAYIRKLQAAAEALLGAYGNVKPVEAHVERVFEVLAHDGDQDVRDRPGARPLVRAAARRGFELRLEDVSFGYERGRPVIQGVSLVARAGETIALVGATGAGKSTLVSLLPRFHDVWSGRVAWDGVDVRELELASLRAQVSLVLQEPFLFPISVAENIAYGRPSAARREIVAAAEAANADAFIRRLPRGYDTVLGERGDTLSGGERQRLAIARAMLKDAGVLLLDEPTSALDSLTEQSVVEALHRLMAGRTTFIIAHRLSTVRGADRVVVLDAGRAVGVGTHEELLVRSDVYRRLHALHAGAPSGEAVA